MGRIGTAGVPGPGRIEAVRPVAARSGTEAPASRALVVIDGGRTGTRASAASLRDGRAEAGFVAQLLIGADPTLQTSRLVRTRQAAASYAEMARRLA
jgi:hypothetical protein